MASYSYQGDHVRVEVFPNRVEISSPGRFPSFADPADPASIMRYARNPRIARACAEPGYGQELGARPTGAALASAMANQQMSCPKRLRSPRWRGKTRRAKRGGGSEGGRPPRFRTRARCRLPVAESGAAVTSETLGGR